MTLPTSPPDEPEQLTSHEILDLLLKDLPVKIGNEEFELWEITDKIDIEKLRELVQDGIKHDFDIRCTYCEVIGGLMG